jgi:hypothetical protein
LTYGAPPLKLAETDPLTRPLTRPFNLDIDCVLALLPDINTKWIDYSRNSNHATLTNTALRHSGRYGPALYLNGSNAYGIIADSAELRFTTPFSISVWAKRLAASVDAYGCIQDKGSASANRNFQINWANVGTINFKVRDVTNGADRNASIAGYNETGVWRHICGVYDGTNVNVYVDGVVGTATAVVGTVATSAHEIKIGKLAYAAGSNYMFNGLLDEILIFNRELKLREIQAITNMGKSP